jgi:hypothetical protein
MSQVFDIRFRRVCGEQTFEVIVSVCDSDSVSDIITKVKATTKLGFDSQPCKVVLTFSTGQTIHPMMKVRQLTDQMGRLPEPSRTLTVITTYNEAAIEISVQKKPKFDSRVITKYRRIQEFVDLLKSSGFQEYADEVLLDPSVYEIYRKQTTEDWIRDFKIPELSELFYNLLHETTFDPENYRVQFPFFLPGPELYMPLLDRKDVLIKVNKIASRLPNEPLSVFTPIAITSSKGTGKTFFMKMFALQRFKDNYKIKTVEEAKNCGRIISFDFKRQKVTIRSPRKALSFIKRLLIFYLCLNFQGTYVDGIYFETIPFDCITRKKSIQFSEWFNLSLDSMIEEYMRLTNIAFKVDCKIPPIFLFDEIQELKKSLSILLSSMSQEYKPICICSGLDHGGIDKHPAGFRPLLLGLTPLVNCSHIFWDILLRGRNRSRDTNIDASQDQETINMLIFASCKVPRLTLIAFNLWYTLKSAKVVMKPEDVMRRFRRKVSRAYPKMSQMLTRYSVSDISHILLSCAVRFGVESDSDFVPGTNITWRSLIKKSMIFSYSDFSYVLPFSLIWKTSEKIENAAIQKEIENVCKERVPGLELTKLFPTYDRVNSLQLKDQETEFEYLFAASLAVKYYLLFKYFIPRYREHGNSFFKFESICYLGEEKSQTSAEKHLASLEVDFSKGLLIHQASAGKTVFPPAVIFNALSAPAHQKLLLPTKSGIISVQSSVEEFLPSQEVFEARMAGGSDTLIVLCLDKSSVDVLGSIDEKRNNLFVELDCTGVFNGINVAIYQSAIKAASTK